jgi:hypothetical protein
LNLGVSFFILNPIRAGIVKDLKSLNGYAYAGHSIIMGKRKNSWQDTVFTKIASFQRCAALEYKTFADR